ncbi:MAG TPA: peptidylprolyl isomerase [Planctomycetota bacterium]|nr:peptidylprolyl isomerase [Planctomycetota bacterium]
MTKLIHALIAICILSAFCGVAEEGKPKIPAITVNGEKVEAAQIEVLYKRILANYQRLTKTVPTAEQRDNLALQARQQVVQQAVVKQYVASNKIVATPEALVEEEKVMREQLEAAGMKYDEFLKERGQTAEDFRAELAPMAALLQSCSGMLQQDKLKADFEKAKSKVPLRRCSHILFMHQKSPRTTQKARSPEEAKRLAEEALALVRGGQEFADVAREKSDCPSKASGGDLGWFLAEAMVKPFSDAAFALEKAGDVAPVVETEFGYHVIKLTGLRTPEEAYTVFVRRTTEAKAMEVVSKLMREAKVSDQE